MWKKLLYLFKKYFTDPPRTLYICPILLKFVLVMALSKFDCSWKFHLNLSNTSYFNDRNELFCKLLIYSCEGACLNLTADFIWTKFVINSVTHFVSTVFSVLKVLRFLNFDVFSILVSKMCNCPRKKIGSIKILFLV